MRSTIIKPGKSRLMRFCTSKMLAMLRCQSAGRRGRRWKEEQEQDKSSLKKHGKDDFNYSLLAAREDWYQFGKGKLATRSTSWRVGLELCKFRAVTNNKFAVTPWTPVENSEPLKNGDMSHALTLTVSRNHFNPNSLEHPIIIITITITLIVRLGRGFSRMVWVDHQNFQLDQIFRTGSIPSSGIWSLLTTQHDPFLDLELAGRAHWEMAQFIAMSQMD